jgi:hypothetical protein
MPKLNSKRNDFMFQRKKRKMRTKDEIDKDYTNHAVQIGHKARVVAQLQEEIDAHITKLVDINKEAMLLPPEPVKPVDAPQVQDAPATIQENA